MRNNPGLKGKLRMAYINETPEKFVKRRMTLALYFAIVMVVVFFMFTTKYSGSKALGNLKFIPLIFIVAFIGVFFFMIQAPSGIIKKRERDINKEVLFAGRFLLVEMESGVPLFNALINASQGYGVCSKYFKEIVDEINTGTPIEQALENARNYNASEKFKKILWHLVTALKTGTDVTEAMRSTLNIITQEQAIEIKEYSKKLNSIMMFYMIGGVVMPSLGIALLIIFGSFVNLAISGGTLFSMLFMIGVLQLMFIVLIKASRPMVNL